jgi:hypothetical protein
MLIADVILRDEGMFRRLPRKQQQPPMPRPPSYWGNQPLLCICRGPFSRGGTKRISFLDLFRALPNMQKIFAYRLAFVPLLPFAF